MTQRQTRRHMQRVWHCVRFHSTMFRCAVSRCVRSVASAEAPSLTAGTSRATHSAASPLLSVVVAAAASAGLAVSCVQADTKDDSTAAQSVSAVSCMRRGVLMLFCGGECAAFARFVLKFCLCFSSKSRFSYCACFPSALFPRRRPPPSLWCGVYCWCKHMLGCPTHDCYS